ncbi:hypothetical protein [Leptospira levettii]|uniref:hypothetical protein n=1 Tax=Leptospira levettii TaxID=2023178 RepID=UPI000F64031F|nr:hypothetical protein [Leptospira levettii]
MYSIYFWEETFNSFKKHKLPYILFTLGIWFPPILEAILNKGGNFIKILTAKTPGQGISFELLDIRPLFFNFNLPTELVQPGLAVSLLAFIYLIIAKNSEKSHKMVFSVIAVSFLMPSLIGGKEFYYFAYLYPFVLVAFLVGISKLRSRLRFYAVALITFYGVLNLGCVSKKYINGGWNDFPLTQINELTEEIRVLGHKKVNLFIDGPKSISLGLPILIVLSQKGVEADPSFVSPTSVYIHTSGPNCQVNFDSVKGTHICF